MNTQISLMLSRIFKVMTCVYIYWNILYMINEYTFAKQ